MRFQVPQFTDVEDKIVGPFTIKQFVYLAGAGGACVVIYSFLPLFLAIPLMLPIAAFGLALAFYKINNKPFIYIVEAYFKYIIGSRLYIWKRQPKEPEVKRGKNEDTSESFVPKLTSSKLKDLSWSLDVKEQPLERPRDQN